MLIFPSHFSMAPRMGSVPSRGRRETSCVRVVGWGAWTSCIHLFHTVWCRVHWKISYWIYCWIWISDLDLLNFNILQQIKMSAESKVVSTNWRLVQVGRVVLVQNKLAAIVEIIDQKRVCIIWKKKRKEEKKEQLQLSVLSRSIAG